jgi:uncharacterized membrane protein YqhA
MMIGPSAVVMHMTTPSQSRLGLLPYLIFSSRWLQLPLYLGLIVAQAVYVVQFVRELWHLLDSTLFNHIDGAVAAESAVDCGRFHRHRV